MPQGLTNVLEEWKGLEDEYQQLQETHRMYLQKLDEISKLQNNCSSSISRQRKRLKEISQRVKECNKGPSDEDAKNMDEIKEKIKTRPNAFFEMEAFLPKKNGLYLSLVLGNVNVTLLSKQSKFAYKDEYEKFKLCSTVLLLLCSFICCFFVSYRFLDAILNFLLVWYYCTLTIRESILITNGSRCDADMARWEPLQGIQEPVPRLLLVSKFCSVSAVLLSEWMSVQTTSPGRKTQHGSDRGGISVVDVERADVSFTLPLFWSFLAALQWPLSLQNGSAPRL
ncbi:transmembrane protein 120A-like isoform X3 [Seriola lalandi dorsalis]|uniref:transmembrane protein 120A-like isoform X3 n=1 Tax=Seriola lalandi dorsalis TaxID=1841481 RepID=UPI000C6F7746|nr:transmembrane protein 120A-like isoform X3 [Seriola lalandi dorsalis]